MTAETPGNKQVTIPPSLIRRLQPFRAHFCLVCSPSCACKAHGKSPHVGGKGWQKKENLMEANDPRLQAHLKNGGNYGVVGGFGLVMADADIPEIKQILKEKLPETYMIESPGSHGWHAYFLCGLEKAIKLKDKEGKNAGDIQGPGKMVVGPNSNHPNGGVYKVVKDIPFARVTAKELREALKDWITKEESTQTEPPARQKKAENQIDLNISQVVSLIGLQKRGNEYSGSHPVHGSTGKNNFTVNTSKNVWHCFRHDTGGGPLLWLAVKHGIIECSQAVPGVLRGEKFKEAKKIAIEMGLIQARTNKKDTPTTTQEENRLEFEERKQSHTDLLIELALNQNPVLFYDQYELPYAQINIKNALNIVALRSRKFKIWLASLMWKHMRKAPSDKALKSAINILQAEANENSRHTLYNRVAPAEDGIWLDMTDDKWRAIKVTAEGWNIVDKPSILFRRYSHQQPMPDPIKGGDHRKFFDFVNIYNDEDPEKMEEDKETELIITTMIIHDLIPEIPHVIPHPYGEQGTTKSFLMKIWRSLIDPSSTGLLSLPRNIIALIQQLSHNWLAFYDNLSYLPDWISDAFCRACTGGGTQKRQLWTDDEDINIFVKNCPGLNGINVSARRGDLLERTVLLGLRPIAKEQRKEEVSFRAEFEKQKPEILGGFLDLLVKTLKAYPTVKPEKLFRMADFTRYGCAVAKALDKPEDEFITAYENKNKKQVEESVRSSPVGSVLMDFIDGYSKKEWYDSPTQLLMVLTEHAKNTNVSTRQKLWPKAPAILTDKLQYLISNLKSLNYEVITGLRDPETNKRRIHIINHNKTPPTFEDTEDGKIRKKIYNYLTKNKKCTFDDLQKFVSENSFVESKEFLNNLMGEKGPLGFNDDGYVEWKK